MVDGSPCHPHPSRRCLSCQSGRGGDASTLLIPRYAVPNMKAVARLAFHLLVVLGTVTSASSGNSRFSAVRRRTESRLTSSTTATLGAPTREPRKACPFYVWNAPSALMYKWCQHLMQDHIYEGRSGVKVCCTAYRWRWMLCRDGRSEYTQLDSCNSTCFPFMTEHSLYASNRDPSYSFCTHVHGTVRTVVSGAEEIFGITCIWLGPDTCTHRWIGI